MPVQRPGASRGLSRSRFPWRSCLLGLLVVLSLGYLALRGAGAFLITGDRLEPGDAVAVLGGGGEDRVVEAVRLVQEGYGRWLVITEPGEMAQGQGPGSQVFRQVVS